MLAQQRLGGREALNGECRCGFGEVLLHRDKPRELRVSRVAGGRITARGVERREFLPGLSEVRFDLDRSRERGESLGCAARGGARAADLELDQRRAWLPRLEFGKGRPRLRVAAISARRAEQQRRRRVARM